MLTYGRWIQWTREFPEAAQRLVALTLTAPEDRVHPVTEAYSAHMLVALQAYAAAQGTDPDPAPSQARYA